MSALRPAGGVTVTVSPDADATRVKAALAALGLWATPLVGGRRVLLSVGAHSADLDLGVLSGLDGVEDVAVSPSGHPALDAQPPVVDVAGIPIGPGADPVLLAGPCAVEDEATLDRIARAVAGAGGRFLRGGAYKPRTSPYAFDGHGAPALAWLEGAARRHGLKVVTEVLSEQDVDAVAEVADLLQVGARNMQNYALLHAIGRSGRPVLLKRGLSATVDEWCLAAEHLLAAGSGPVVLCERGVRGFDPQTRFVLDLAAVALLAGVRGLPVIVDPSHAAGRRDLVEPLSHAALAAGAAGLLIETHVNPSAARSDAAQALAPERLGTLLAGPTALPLAGGVG